MSLNRYRIVKDGEYEFHTFKEGQKYNEDKWLGNTGQFELNDDDGEYYTFYKDDFTQDEPKNIALSIERNRDAYESAIYDWLDSKCTEMGFVGESTTRPFRIVGNYQGFNNAFREDSERLGKWISVVFEEKEAMEKQILMGEREMPTIEEVLEELSSYEEVHEVYSTMTRPVVTWGVIPDNGGAYGIIGVAEVMDIAVGDTFHVTGLSTDNPDDLVPNGTYVITELLGDPRNMRFELNSKYIPNGAPVQNEGIISKQAPMIAPNAVRSYVEDGADSKVKFFDDGYKKYAPGCIIVSVNSFTLPAEDYVAENGIDVTLREPTMYETDKVVLTAFGPY